MHHSTSGTAYQVTLNSIIGRIRPKCDEESIKTHFKDPQPVNELLEALELATDLELIGAVIDASKDLWHSHSVIELRSVS